MFDKFRTQSYRLKNYLRKIGLDFGSKYANGFIILFVLVLIIVGAFKYFKVDSITKVQAHRELECAEEFRKAGKLDSAINHAQTALTINRHTDSAYTIIGQIALSRGQWQIAESRFRSGLQENPHNIDARMGLADALKKQNMNQQAIAQYQKLLHENPNHFSGQFGIANALYTRSKTDSSQGIPIDDLDLSESLTIKVKEKPQLYSKITHGHAIDDVLLATPYFEQVLENPERNQQLSLQEYITLFDNLAALANESVGRTLFKSSHIRRSVIARDIACSVGDVPGAIELTEGLFYLYEHSEQQADSAFEIAKSLNPTLVRTIDSLKHSVTILERWNKRTTVAFENVISSQFRFNRHRTGQLTGSGVVWPKIKWRTRIGKVGMISPIFYENRLIQVAPDLGGIAMIDASNGEILHLLVKEDGFSNTVPAIGNNCLWIDAPRGTMYVLAMSEFDYREKFEDTPIREIYYQEIIDSSPLLRSSSTANRMRVLFCTRMGQFRSAMLTNNNIANWVWNEGLGGQIAAPPVLGNDLAMFGSNDKRFYAVDHSAPKAPFYLRTAWIYYTNSIVTASAAYSKGVVYFGCHNGILHAVPEKTFQEREEGGFKMQSRIAFYPTNGAIIASPAIDDSLVYFCSTDSTIYALPTFEVSRNTTDLSSVRQGRWYPKARYKALGAIQSSPCITGGVLYVGTDAGEILALQAGDITQALWRIVVNGAVRSSPFVFNRTLYIAADDGYLYAIGQ